MHQIIAGGEAANETLAVQSPPQLILDPQQFEDRRRHVRLRRPAKFACSIQPRRGGLFGWEYLVQA